MKVLVKIKDNIIYLQNKKKLNTEYKNMLNTNVISHDELVFSDEYIKSNYKLVSSFIGEIIKEENIYIMSFQNVEIANLFLPIIDKFKEINTINIESDETPTFTFFDTLSNYNNIKFIICESLPKYVFDILDKKDIKVKSRNEICFISNFMNNNNLNSYSSIYYKKEVEINLPIEEVDLNDFENFLKINNKLREINIKNFNKKDFDTIISILEKNVSKLVKVIINDDITDEKTINYLKEKNQYLLDKKIVIGLKYSKKFLEENALGQTNLFLLRAISFIMVSIVICSVSYVIYDNYSSSLKDTKLKEEIKKTIEEKPIEREISIPDDTNEEKIIVNDYLLSLKTVNEDTVAWIKVNNTNIDYAVLQSKDNNYYLEYNFYKEKDPNGWVFMDFENNPEEIDDNIILYGHHRYVNGVMFGTLTNALNKKWYENKENHIIKFDTLYGSYEYEVFSIYVIPTTNDYISTSFTQNEKIEFLERIKNRSIYDFNVDLNVNDKILTLSTCKGTTSKMVMHAKLVNQTIIQD